MKWDQLTLGIQGQIKKSNRKFNIKFITRNVYIGGRTIRDQYTGQRMAVHDWQMADQNYLEPRKNVRPENIEPQAHYCCKVK